MAARDNENVTARVAAESVESVGWRCADGRTGGWAAAMLQKGHAGDILCN
ncbi:uncharacterized protein ANIA_11407 [Aspergillus nidulans FGSC A4]|uniref:Uncharacterized protein n=1 Tax=Emericella nidulans (strain FGSC A4 / ATCC 38163 / CBS 112.46 / NRRL 194 / M139) TaxID=227321 RepID=C8V3W3_EMENI|nr:hypothetical protein [Aspergillus nidulans FGSC A4]CBF75697.1 TPA: hypothetical protein ANIA_11407 [Aspergillus nidulans FGSC A4]